MFQFISNPQNCKFVPYIDYFDLFLFYYINYSLYMFACLGFLIYFLYGIHHSAENTTKKNSVKLIGVHESDEMLNDATLISDGVMG